MSLLQVLLIVGMDEDYPFTKVFPPNYKDQKLISELMTITKNFKNCGKGRLQHKNKIFYYRTYTPEIQKDNDTDNSDYDESLCNSHNRNYHKRKYFLIYLCDLKYKSNDIELLTNEIFEILDNDTCRDGRKINKETSDQINEVFKKYKKLQPNFGKCNQLTDIISDNLTPDNDDNDNNSRLTHFEGKTRYKMTFCKKRAEPRMTMYKKKEDKRSKTTTSSIIDDSHTIKDHDTDLSIMFKQNIDENMYLPQVNRWRNIKIVNIIMCLFVLGVVLFLSIFSFRYI